jgi:WhiB family redox-sensing transcriptional regulator
VAPAPGDRRVEYERGVGILPLDDDEVYENYLAVS